MKVNMLKAGDVLTWERTFTVEDVLRFAEVTGDQGIHHMEADKDGRLLVHGLLTASISTKLGGELNFLAQEMNFKFLRPVYTGDTIRCEITLTRVEEENGHTRQDSKLVFTNQLGKEVLFATSTGIVRHRD
jgi:acyl dehydratase